MQEQTTRLHRTACAGACSKQAQVGAVFNILLRGRRKQKSCVKQRKWRLLSAQLIWIQPVFLDAQAPSQLLTSSLHWT